MNPAPLRSLLLCTLAACALGQAAPPAAPTSRAVAPVSRPDYSQEAAVIERLDSVYQYAEDGTGWREVTMAIRVQTEAAVRQLGVLTVPYAGNSERVELAYVRVRRPDGTVIETPVGDAMELADPVTREAPFYSDLKQKQLPVRSLRAGDTLEWQARVLRTKAEAPGSFWGQHTFATGVVLEESLELRIPQATYVQAWSPSLKPIETSTGPEHIFRWTTSQTRPTTGKEADAERERKNKQVWTAEQELEAVQGALPSVAWTSFRNWEAVGAWYRTLEGDRAVPDAETRARAAELTAGKATDEEKVRAIYNYVATQVRYVGVAFGVGRYQPHPAAEVLRNQYGDCKDKHTLLAAMLSAGGFHADAALIGVGVRFNPAVPSPAAFNHLITTVRVAGDSIWLDTTTEVAPYRVLMYVIRDRTALVVPDAGVARLEQTPARLPFASSQTMDAIGTLDADGTSKSQIALTTRGDDELVLRSVLHQLSPAQYEPMVQRLSQNMGYGGTVTHPEISRPEDTVNPLKISYDYKRDKAGDWANYKIVPQVSPVLLPRPDEKEPPVRAILLGVPRVEMAHSAMKLPAGWGAELPEAVHAKSAYATYDETYRLDQGTLYAERRVEVLQEKVPVADWKAYKTWADAVDLGNEQYVQLTRTGAKLAVDGAANIKGPPLATGSNVEAQRLVASGYEAMQRHDLDEARSLLDQARKLNAEQAWLWTTYGLLEFQRGEISLAMVDYQKELSLHPDRFETYGYLAQVQSALGREKEAKETLQRWAEADKSSQAPWVAMAWHLLAEKDGPAAIAAVEMARARIKDNPEMDEAMQVILGRAQWIAGMKDKSRDTFVELLERTRQSSLMNAAAYELADHGQALPQSETAAHKAVAMMEEESKTWTLDEAPQVLRGKTEMLLATWDTVGWIYFRQGKNEEALSYLNAAWRNSPRSTNGEHLGEVREATGDKSGALTAYQLAQAAAFHYDALGVKQPPDDEEKALVAHIDALQKAGVKSALTDAEARAALQAMRTLPLGTVNGLKGTAEYRLLLSEGRIKSAEPIGDKHLAGGREQLFKARLTGFWPQGSTANLVRTGILNCHGGVCELVLEP